MQLTDKIHLLQIDFEVAIAPGKVIPRFVNILIIFGETIKLIDTGVKDSEPVIFDYIQKQGRKVSEIDTIILSHSHPDHIGSAAKIKEATGCRVIAHKKEQHWIENIALQNQQRPVPGFFNLVSQSVDIDYLVGGNNEEIKLDDGLTIRLIEAPGHSAGSLNILFIEDKILFTADSIPVKNDIPNYDNFAALMKSLENIRRNTEYDILLSSWMPALTRKEEIEKVLAEGETYMRRIDHVVRKHYRETDGTTLEYCKSAIEELGLPLVFVNLIVDNAFKAHLQ